MDRTLCKSGTQMLAWASVGLATLSVGLCLVLSPAASTASGLWASPQAVQARPAAPPSASAAPLRRARALPGARPALHRAHSVRAAPVASGPEAAAAAPGAGTAGLRAPVAAALVALPALLLGVLLGRRAGAAPQPQVYFDLTVDGQSFGRVVIELFDDGAVGAQRFADLARNVKGIGYRRSKIDAITPSYVRMAGVTTLTYSDAEPSPIAGGKDLAALERAMGARRHDGAGLVSLLVRDEKPREVKEKLVARNGSLQVVRLCPNDKYLSPNNGQLTVVEEVGPPPPNGTAFCITTAAAPTLDGTSLVVGRVVEGMDLVQRIAALPTVPDNTGSPLFAAAKSIGDKRASVAELGFNRPYAKVVVKGSGVTASVAMAAGTGAKTGGSPGPAAPPRRIAVANVVGKKLPNNKCLKCGRGTDSIPCVRCGNKDRNTFATIRICPSCQGYGTRERRSEGNWWANLFTAGSDGAGDGSGVQEKCPKCGGQGVQLIRNSDWS